MKRYLVIALSFFCMAGCKQDEYASFSDHDRLQFGPKPADRYIESRQLNDTLKRYTFYYEAEHVIRDTVYFDLYTVGSVSDSDRPFQLKQEIVPNVENAVSGKHYLPFDHSDLEKEYVIKAGSAHKSVPIILLRDPSLKETEVTLKFKVKENDFFQAGVESYTWRKVIYTDKLSRPAGWDEWISTYFYGNYSLKKHEFMIEATGREWNQEFFEEIRPVYAVLDYWRSILRKAVADYNRDKRPQDYLSDENGLIVF